MSADKTYLYQQLADELKLSMRNGVLKPGQRLPSVRELQRRRGLSTTTILQAFALLERQGWIESRPRSGYFAKRRPGPASPAILERPQSDSTQVDVSDLVFRILGATRERQVLPFGSAFPCPTLFPLKRLAASLARSSRRMDPWVSVQDLPPGSLRLRQEISRRYLSVGVDASPDALVVTNGAMEALNLSLQAVTRPGDVVAIESPSFYAPLQAIERLHLRAVEVPTHPDTGVDCQALRQVLDAHPVRACWFMSSFQNPLGASVPEAGKQAIVDLLAERGIPLIEDDVYTELHFGETPPRPFKYYDRQGLVLHCGGFSKCLAPGFRVGWAAAGRYTDALLRLKMMTSLATSIPSQEALADFLQQPGYEVHLRRLRARLQAQQLKMMDLIDAHFPEGTRATRPDGGYFTWLTLPTGIDALALHARALEHGIGLTPGPMFSARRAFGHSLRLNYGHPWTPELEAGLRRLGDLAAELGAAAQT